MRTGGTDEASEIGEFHETDEPKKHRCLNGRLALKLVDGGAPVNLVGGYRIF